MKRRNRIPGNILRAVTSDLNPVPVLANVFIRISSFVPREPSWSADLMVYTIDCLRLHPSSCKAAAFLIESSNRVIITGRNLKTQLRPDGFGSKEILRTYTTFPLLHGKQFGE
jgi:hypothetical protein